MGFTWNFQSFAGSWYLLQLRWRLSCSGILLVRPRSQAEDLGRDVLHVRAGSDPIMEVSFAALVGMGSLRVLGGVHMVPLLSATRCLMPEDWMLAKQHHSSLELSAKMKQIHRNN